MSEVHGFINWVDMVNRQSVSPPEQINHYSVTRPLKKKSEAGVDLALIHTHCFSYVNRSWLALCADQLETGTEECPGFAREGGGGGGGKDVEVSI